MPKKQAKKSAEDEYRKYYCVRCGARLTNQETRAFLEGRYTIDPNGDDRQLCENCKA